MIDVNGDLALGLADYWLVGIAWLKEGEDIQVILLSPDRRRTVEVVCVWATGVKIDMDFGVYSGAPLLFDAVFTKVEKDAWHVEFKFGAAPEGYMELSCNDLIVKELVDS